MTKKVCKEVQFCSAVTCGDTATATRLLPEINVFQKIDFEFGISPVVFCLWAARQDHPEIAIQKLNDYFPLVSYRRRSSSPTQIADTLKIVLDSLNHQYSSVGMCLLRHVADFAPLEIPGREEQHFILSCCMAALEFILEESHIRPIIKDAALKLKEKLKIYVKTEPSESQKNHEIQALPDCMQKLRSYLNEGETEALYLFSKQRPPAAYLPAQQQRIAQLTEQINKGIEESRVTEPGEHLESTENMIAFLVPSQQRPH